MEVKDIIIKDRDRSLKLEGLIAAQSRLAPGHPMLPVLAGKQAAVEAGIGGEERVAEVYRKVTFSFPYHVFHDLSLSDDEKFQIDTFVKTPWYGVILDAKNISGILEFRDNPPQLVRTRDDGRQDGLESPVVQLEKNYDLLQHWLWRRNIQLPLYSAIVIAYPKQIIAVPPANTKLLFPNSIPSYIRNIPQQTQKLDIDAFNLLSDELLASHHRFIPKPISETYRIPISDFKPGVRCGACHRIGMVKVFRTWQCPYCGATDPFAHYPNLLEWFLVFKSTITNQECRWFLGVDVQTAKRILTNMNGECFGKNRYRSYLINPVTIEQNCSKTMAADQKTIELR